MVAFIMHTIFTVFIVILSLGDILAPPTKEQITNTNTLRSKCCKTLNTIFPGVDIKAHAIKAMTNYILKPDMDGNLFAYITMLKDNSYYGRIAPANSFCALYKHIDLELCEGTVQHVFGYTPEEALKNAYISTDPADVQQFHTKFTNLQLKKDPYYQSEINFLMDYWNVILNNVEVDNTETGVIPKQNFCHERHPYPE